MPIFGNIKKMFTEYRCPECGKTFGKEAELHNHIKIHEAKNMAEQKPDTRPEIPNIKIFSEECPDCGLPFQTKKQKISHQKEHEEYKKNPSIVGVYGALYAGGKSDLKPGDIGNLLLYAEPFNKVVFKSPRATLEIPFNSIRRVKMVTKEQVTLERVLLIGLWALLAPVDRVYLMLGVENDLGDLDDGVFQIFHVHEFYDKLRNLRLEYKQSRTNSEINI